MPASDLGPGTNPQLMRSCLKIPIEIGPISRTGGEWDTVYITVPEALNNLPLLRYYLQGSKIFEGPGVLATVTLKLANVCSQPPEVGLKTSWGVARPLGFW